MTKKLVRKPKELSKYWGSKDSETSNPFLFLFKTTIAESKDYHNSQVYSTFKYASGKLLYTHSESEHNNYLKVPDIKFVDYGMWVYED